MTSSRFSVSVHILTLLAKAEGEMLSSEYMAGSININPVLVRKEIMNLKKHRFILSKEGKNGGSYLSRPSADIRLSEVYWAVRQSAPLGKLKNKPNPNCEVGKHIQQNLIELFGDAEKAFVHQLEKVTLKKFASQFG